MNKTKVEYIRVFKVCLFESSVMKINKLQFISSPSSAKTVYNKVAGKQKYQTSYEIISPITALKFYLQCSHRQSFTPIPLLSIES